MGVPNVWSGICREAFEEAGIWLGEGTPSQELRDALNSRTGNLRWMDLLKADLTRIRQWSWWITPDTEPKRYDTRFFVCIVPYEPDVEIIPDASETVEARWLTPADAIRLHMADELFMAPPTYLTLMDMCHFTTTDEVWRQKPTVCRTNTTCTR